MADTLSLDAAVAFVTARGGQVRLIGDNQQLAAIGAGGVLRDIAATHGALHLTELMRFTDPAEGAASLALRDGQHRGARVLPRPRPGPRRRPRHHHRRTSSPPGPTTARRASTRSCSPPPATWSPSSTSAPKPTASPAATPGPGCAWPTATPPMPGDTDHHPHQRPPPAPRRDRLGQERRPVDRPRTSTPTGHSTVQHAPHRPTGHPARRLRRRLPPSSATPPPSTAPKASPSTPSTAWPPARRPASSSTRCSPAAPTPTTSTSQVVGDGDPQRLPHHARVTPAARGRLGVRWY